MSYSLNDHTPQQTKENLVSLDDFPILNQLEADKVFNATFLKYCGSKYVCESKLQLTADFSLKPLREIDGMTVIVMFSPIHIHDIETMKKCLGKTFHVLFPATHSSG